MPEVNNQQYQHAMVRAMPTSRAGVFPLRTFSKIAYSAEATKEPTNDAQGDVDGFTFMPLKIDASLTLKLSEYFAFREWLLAQNPGLGLLQCQFDLPVTYGHKIIARKTDTLRGAMLQKDMRDSQDNQKVLMVEVPLFVLRIEFANGGPSVAYDQF